MQGPCLIDAMSTAPTTGDLLIRLGLALAAGLVVGFERESHGRPAGLRTTVLVCVSSAIAMILSEHLFVSTATATAAWRPDPARLAAGILTGMGFLGAGSIIRQDNAVRGLTTAAALWFVTVLGLAFGSGYIFLGLCGLLVAMLTLFVLPHLENHVKNDWYGTVTVTIEMDRVADDEIRARIERSGVRVKQIDLEYDLVARRKILRCAIKFKKTDLFGISQKTVQELVQCPGVSQVTWS